MGKGRSPCCDKSKVKRGPWSPQEDLRLINFIQKNGHTNWRSLPKQADLLRCGKSCRLRWLNYLRPDIKRGNFTKEDEEMIIKLHRSLGNKWSKIASYFPGRTDNEIKNVWNTHLKKRLNEKETDSTNLNKNETKELSKSSSFSSCSSSCISNLSHNENQETRDGTDGGKQEIEISKENSSPSNSSIAPDYFLNDNIIDLDIMQTTHTDFLINEAYQENYEMFFNPDQDIGIFPREIDFEYLEMLEKEDPIYSYQSQTKEFEIWQRNFGQGNESENECMKWMKNLENELLLETSNEEDQSFIKLNYGNTC